MDLAQELLAQKDALEEAPGVTVEGQDLASREQGHAYSGCVKIDLAHPYRSQTTNLDLSGRTLILDLYDYDDDFRVSAHQPGAGQGQHWSDEFTRYTVPDVLILVSSLIYRATGSRAVDLDTDHWPSCRVKFTKIHPTARRERRTRKILHRGSYLECWEYLQDALEEGPMPSDMHFSIEGDVPAKHTVEEPPVETKSDELPF